MIGFLRCKIGESAAWSGADGVVFVGTITDMRDDEHGERRAYIATLGWPEMSSIRAQDYQRLEDGVWRKCLHDRGYSLAGICFDCGVGFAVPAEEEKP